ncbi:unnamed protein product [Gulo gulo]|uniref:Protein phosphatase 1 regulatory subunit 14 n=1 Tax=Gulo gulo TaxID=48420 RepID=A0A9X9M529_GULGU|nr:unnamed protein product [Gulo gulo]
MSVATGSSEAAGGAGGGGGARVFFQSPRGGAGGSPGSSSGSGSSREQGKVTVKYDRKELRKRLVLEEWIVEQLGQLYGCEVPERGAGRVGGLPRRTVPTQEFSVPGPLTPWDPALGARRWACSLRGALWRRGATVGTPLPGSRCPVPAEVRAPWMAVGRAGFC